MLILWLIFCLSYLYVLQLKKFHHHHHHYQASAEGEYADWASLFVSRTGEAEDIESGLEVMRYKNSLELVLS
jgi:hypothetical protein